MKAQLVEKALTGYTWHYYSSEANAFSLFSKESSVDQSEKAVQGGGSKVTWLFSPETLGSFAIIFKLYREWEGEEKAVDIRVFNVEMDDRTLSECILDYVTVLDSSPGFISRVIYSQPLLRKTYRLDFHGACGEIAKS
ncbi:protease inhibitor I42 family protein [Mesotoga sp. H07pep.5.4]|uniref:protease inhibitor I42 family protein n=1 Tax=Mesotoga sp. H07pep.5.4 TaxID=1463664 RepID=UPI0038F7AFED